MVTIEMYFAIAGVLVLFAGMAAAGLVISEKKWNRKMEAMRRKAEGLDKNRF